MANSYFRFNPLSINYCPHCLTYRETDQMLFLANLLMTTRFFFFYRSSPFKSHDELNNTLVMLFIGNGCKGKKTEAI